MARLLLFILCALAATIDEVVADSLAHITRFVLPTCHPRDLELGHITSILTRYSGVDHQERSDKLVPEMVDPAEDLNYYLRLYSAREGFCGTVDAAVQDLRMIVYVLDLCVIIGGSRSRVVGKSCARANMGLKW